MKKIRGSIMAKLIAWIAFLVGIGAAAAGGALTIMAVDGNCYTKSYKQVIDENYDTLNSINNNRAFSRYINSWADDWSRNLDRNFKYGIVKADTLKDIELSSRDSYVSDNFSQADLDKIADNPNGLMLTQIRCYFNSNGDYTIKSIGYYEDYLDSNNVFRAGVYLDGESVSGNNGAETSDEWKSFYADSVCYDTTGGIFYYYVGTTQRYYPVQSVTLSYTSPVDGIARNYAYSYDFDEKAYIFNSVWESGETEEETTYYGEPGEMEGAGKIEDTEEIEETDENIIRDAHSGSEKAESDSIETLLMGDEEGRITFDKLNGTSFNYKCWGMLVMDNIRWIDASGIKLINAKNIAKQSFKDSPGYYLDENYTLIVNMADESEDYWVVSIVPSESEINANLNSDSQYEQRKYMLRTAYNLRYIAIYMFIAGIIVTLASFFFLVYSAGYRKNSDTVVKLPIIDRMPLEILTAIVIAAGMALVLAVDIVFELDSRYVMLGIDVSMAAALVMAGILCAFLLSLTVRVRAGKWWRGSICYSVYKALGKAASILARNISLLWKVIVVLTAVSVVELIAISICWYEMDTLIILWFIEKVIIFVVFIWLAMQLKGLQEGSRRLADGDLQYKISTEKMFWECRKHAENLNKISDGMSKAVDERMKSERLKTELITNVSHDIKTPLTSIINYVDLLEKEHLENEKAVEYLEVLERQSAKLKKLTEDLVEASKASTGNLEVENEQIEAGVFLTQTVGEFEERLSAAGLELIVSKPDDKVYITADGRHLWRVVDNLMNNICKYAQPGSRVYVNLETTDEDILIIFRNMSKFPLNINGDELQERFVRGDKSRNTEGHGLGLSIAKSLMDLMNGEMNIYVDGDLFKVVLKWHIQK